MMISHTCQKINIFFQRDAVKAILTHMTNPSSATALSLSSSGERLAVIVNNLGGTSKLEELVRKDKINWWLDGEKLWDFHMML